MNSKRSSNTDILKFANADELARAAASVWLDEIEDAQQAARLLSVALSGGRITQKLFQETVIQAQKRGVSFENVHFFWADERCVSPTDPDSNYRLANDLLFSKLGKIHEKQIHRIKSEKNSQVAVRDADDEMRRVVKTLGNQPPVLDLVWLGMGEDGHVASLFPNALTEIVNCPAVYVAVNNSPKPPAKRISLSYAAIAASQTVRVLVSGAGKTDALRASLLSAGQTPLGRVLEFRKKTEIFSDLPNI